MVTEVAAFAAVVNMCRFGTESGNARHDQAGFMRFRGVAHGSGNSRLSSRNRRHLSARAEIADSLRARHMPLWAQARYPRFAMLTKAKTWIEPRRHCI
jgi:hypothetical protein